MDGSAKQRAECKNEGDVEQYENRRWENISFGSSVFKTLCFENNFQNLIFGDKKLIE